MKSKIGSMNSSLLPLARMWHDTLIISTIICLLIITNSNGHFPTPFGQTPIDPLAIEPVQPCLQWTGGSFDWPCAATKSLYKHSGKYINKHVIATRAQLHNDDVYLALPRYKSGVPATLVRTTLKKGSCHTSMQPFPCWNMQEEGNCESLQSVVDIFLDTKGVLWVLDVGVVNTLENPIRKCPPKIIAFSVKTGNVLKTIVLEDLCTHASRLQYLVVDHGSDGRCYVYVSDAATRSIIVFDVNASRGYRVVLPKAVTEGCAKRDVLYLALVRKSCGTTVLYLTYLSSKRMFSINTHYLRHGHGHGKVSDCGPKPCKQVIIGTDNGAAIFFRNEGESEVYRWDTNTPYDTVNFRVVYRCQTCQLATHALTDYKRGRMRVLESNFPDFMHNTVGCGAIQQLTIMQGC